MANLWRTKRPRFPRYVSDGSGRDNYIKYNNAGYWEEDQFKIQKKPDYEYPKFDKFHSLFHQAAPVRYIPTGNGRETYIIIQDGMYHDQKPLASFRLDDFLRRDKTIDNSTFKNKECNKSLGEKSYNNQLKSLEKQLINRLYKVPIKLTKKANEKKENFLPDLDIKRDYTKNENDINSIHNIKMKKINKITIKNFNTILSQSQKIENYEMNNNSRRNNNEIDYNIYKKGRIGCRLNGLKPLINCSSETINNSINTEGNQIRNKNYSLRKIKNKGIKRNKLTFSIGPNPNEKRFKTLEY